MQIITILGRILFVVFIYLFLLRVLTVMLADLRSKGILRKAPEPDAGCLEVISGTDLLPKGRKIRIDGRGVTIGRGKDNDIVLPDHYCSLVHAELKH